MTAARKLPRIAKLLHYVLGRQPDEFGLVADADGYVKIKSLLQALSEEQGLVHLRRADLNELLISSPEAGIEMDGERIRAAERTHLPRPEPCDDWPGQLFACIRRRAHGRVLEHGIEGGNTPGVVMSASADMALRIGRRRDPEPVLLTVQPRALTEKGVPLLRYGQHLFLTDALPPGTFTAPPLQQAKPRASKATTTPAVQTEHHPGSFYLKPEAEPGKARRPRRGKHEDPEWKRARRGKRRPRAGKNFDEKF
ncbi:MAG: RNA 2'-phosphotransferase [Deltaproteobacteria bacterium]|nr:RNA 2'-phosphotransferase [Deltaproteobacteria bacterium]